MQSSTKPSLRRRILAVAVIFAVGLAFGRYTAPEKVKIEKEIVTVEATEKKVDENLKTNTNRDRNVRKMVVEVTYPDGRKETRTEYTEDSTTNRVAEKTKDSLENTQKTITERTVEETTYRKSDLSISVIAGSQFSTSGGISAGSVCYGGHIQKSLIGPITVGIWGLSNGTAGGSLGLLF